MSSARQEREAGFTLLELLVAMMLLAMLSLLLFGSLKFGRQVWSTAADGTIGTNAVRAFQNEIREDVARAYPVFIPDAVHPHVDFDGGPSQLMLLAPAHDASGGLERLVIGSDGDVTTIAGRRELANNAAATYVRSLKGVGGMRFNYFGQIKGEDVPAWHGEWRQQTRLPLLVRISAVAGKGVAWPTIVVSPRIAADPTCVYDAATGFCLGR